jgi:putative type III restriction system endonuclease
MNISRANFRFIPLLDFSKTWTDEMLYKKYALTAEEIDTIERMIKPMV